MANRLAFGDNDIVSKHWLKFKVETNQFCYVLTGVFITDLKGQS